MAYAWRESGGSAVFLFLFFERSHSILKAAVRAQKVAAPHFEMGTQMWRVNGCMTGAGQSSRAGIGRHVGALSTLLSAYMCVPALTGMPAMGKMGL